LYNLQLITDRLKPSGNCVYYLELHSTSMNFPHTLCLPFMWFSTKYSDYLPEQLNAVFNGNGVCLL